MNIFTTFKQTQYLYINHDEYAGATWDTWVDNPRTMSGRIYRGVFKPRDNSNLFDESPEMTGDATLNIKPDEEFIDKAYPENMIGDVVIVYANNQQPQKFSVIGYDTAMNYRTGQVEHYRLHLKRLEVER